MERDERTDGRAYRRTKLALTRFRALLLLLLRGWRRAEPRAWEVNQRGRSIRDACERKIEGGRSMWPSYAGLRRRGNLDRVLLRRAAFQKLGRAPALFVCGERGEEPDWTAGGGGGDAAREGQFEDCEDERLSRCLFFC